MMSSFSERMGYGAVENRAELIEELPSYVRIAIRDRIIWNVTYRDRDARYYQHRPMGIKEFIEEISYIRRQEPPENYEDSWQCREILGTLLAELEWYQYYDALEALAKGILSFEVRETDDALCRYPKFQADLNRILERSNVGWVLGPTGEFARRRGIEDASIEAAALATVEDAEPVRDHLTKAKRYLEMRPSDAANSIKESISAVESRGKLIFPGTATLGDVVSRMRRDGRVPSGLITVIDKFYAFANQEPGVRHGGTAVERVEVQDADLCYAIALALVRYLSIASGTE